ncbi:hypothetical protein DITRI_Ditri06bG0047500 [Diplodiscus trichospermus]
MDLLLKQWRNQHESKQQPCSKIPKLLFDPHQAHQQQQHQFGSLAFPLFVPEFDSKVSTNLSALPDSTSRFTRIGSYFNLAQWQELELQVLIYRYMLAGTAVPPELLQQIKKSLFQSPTFLHHPLQHYSHYRLILLQSGYWGKAAMDTEPSWCRRTDGKKWRCSRDVVAGQKCCERHVHHGHNRSRKSVEMPTSNTTITNSNATLPFGGAGTTRCGALKSSSSNTASPLAVVANGPNNFGLLGPSPPIDLLHLNHRYAVCPSFTPSCAFSKAVN